MGDLGKLIVAKGFKELPKVQKIAQSARTGRISQNYLISFQVEAHFPTNFSAFVPGHETRVSKMLEILLSTKTAENVLNPAVWQEADELNQFLVKKLVVTRGERKIRSEQLIAYSTRGAMYFMLHCNN